MVLKVEEKEKEPSYGAGTVVKGRIARMAPYGAFVEFGSHFCGLLHVSEMADGFVEHPQDIVQIGEELFVYILEHDTSNNKFRLRLKGVNQSDGTYDAEQASNESRQRTSNTRSKPSSVPLHLQKRSNIRRQLAKETTTHWKDDKAKASHTSNSLRRILYSSSPEPGRYAMEASTKKTKRNDDNDTDSSSSSTSSSSSSSKERRRRRRRKRRSSSRRRRRSSSKRRRRTRSSSYSSSSDSSSASSSSSSSSSSHGHRRRRGKTSPPPDPPREITTTTTTAPNTTTLVPAATRRPIDSSDDDDNSVGPQPATTPLQLDPNKQSVSYGKDLLPGEGQNMAQFVRDNERIPRRGEIGFSNEQISGWEQSGYVMSGSRHAVMNAVRLRKENQVYSAEEKRALALLSIQEKQEKEAQVLDDFRKMLAEKSQAQKRQAKSGK